MNQQCHFSKRTGYKSDVTNRNWCAYRQDRSRIGHNDKSNRPNDFLMLESWLHCVLKQEIWWNMIMCCRGVIMVVRFLSYHLCHTSSRPGLQVALVGGLISSYMYGQGMVSAECWVGKIRVGKPAPYISRSSEYQVERDHSFYGCPGQELHQWPLCLLVHKTDIWPNVNAKIHWITSAPNKTRVSEQNFLVITSFRLHILTKKGSTQSKRPPNEG